MTREQALEEYARVLARHEEYIISKVHPKIGRLSPEEWEELKAEVGNLYRSIEKLQPLLDNQ